MSDSANPSSLRESIAKAIPTLVVLGILGAGWLAVLRINTGEDREMLVAGRNDGATNDVNVITLPEGKVRAAGLRTETVTPRQIQHTHVIPGRLRYDASKHIDLSAPVEGILTDVFVKPGDVVAEGHLLAVISSPEIGRARAEAMKLEAELALVERRSERSQQLAGNLDSLFRALDEKRDADVIEAAFSTRALGTYRQDLLSAYSKLLLTTKNIESVKPLAASGSIAGRTVRERESEHQIALADYHSIREKAEFDAEQSQMQAKSDLADAQRRLKIARQQRDSLLGYHEEPLTDSTSDSLSRFEVRAPFAGTIESRSYAKSERIRYGDSLFILANTTSLYVASDIRENDWPAVSLKAGESVSLTIPAVPDREFSASVLYVGREVAVEGNAVPLIATLDNSEGLLRPGLFVRVVVPVGESREALAVSPASILRHENRNFVFVAMSHDTFQRVDVMTGVVSDRWVEVTSGLQPGQQVVVNGAFLLKSELLLEGEDE